MDYVRLSPEALLDIQRTICEANKQSLHQQIEEQDRIIQMLNRADATELLGIVCKKLDENNTPLRVLATQLHKLQDTLLHQTALVEKLLEDEPRREE